MNLAIRGISANLGEAPRNTFTNDQHKDLKADFIMANPPFNQKEWREDSELLDDPRWDGFVVPPTGNANYGWILHMLSKLSQNGVAGFLLANGALSSSGDEQTIRSMLVERDLVEAILVLPQNLFYTTDISVTLWILNRNKKTRTVVRSDGMKTYRDRSGEVLFMDLRNMGTPYEKKYLELGDEEREIITSVFHEWRLDGGSYEDIPEFCYSATKREIAEKDYFLAPSRYIEFLKTESEFDFDEKMGEIRQGLGEAMEASEKSKTALLSILEELGYGI